MGLDKYLAVLLKIYRQKTVPLSGLSDREGPTDGVCEYTRYLEVQIEGVNEAGGSGYTMWNNSNRYYMVAD